MTNTVIETAVDDLLDLIAQSNKGDEKAVASLRKRLKDDDGKRLVKECGDLGNQAIQIQLLQIPDLGSRAICEEKCRTMYSELAGEDPSAMEEILAQRIVVCHLHLYALEQAINANQNMSKAQAEFDLKRRNKAHRQLLSAVKSLAQVRKLLGPIRIDAKLEIVKEKSGHDSRFTVPADMLN